MQQVFPRSVETECFIDRYGEQAEIGEVVQKVGKQDSPVKQAQAEDKLTANSSLTFATVTQAAGLRSIAYEGMKKRGQATKREAAKKDLTVPSQLQYLELQNGFEFRETNNLSRQKGSILTTLSICAELQNETVRARRDNLDGREFATRVTRTCRHSHTSLSTANNLYPSPYSNFRWTRISPRLLPRKTFKKPRVIQWTKISPFE